MTFLVTIAALALLIVSATPYLPWQHAAIDLPSHFVFQYAIAAAVLVLIALVFSMPPKIFLLAVIPLFMNLLQLSPFIPFPREAPPHGAALKVLQANVLKLNQDTAKLRALIADENPDIIVAAEVTSEFARLFDEIKAQYPHQNIIVQDRGSFGMAVLSKIPFADVETVYPARPDIPVMLFDVMHDEKKISFVSMHSANPVKDMAARDSEFRIVSAALKTKKNGALVVLGDMNATPYARALRDFCRDLGLVNARDGRGVMGTYHAGWPFFVRIPIDHLLVTEKLAVLDHRIAAPIASDHLPLVTAIAHLK